MESGDQSVCYDRQGGPKDVPKNTDSLSGGKVPIDKTQFRFFRIKLRDVNFDSMKSGQLYLCARCAKAGGRQVPNLAVTGASREAHTTVADQGDVFVFERPFLHN